MIRGDRSPCTGEAYHDHGPTEGAWPYAFGLRSRS
jgi:hypothetical protein